MQPGDIITVTTTITQKERKEFKKENPPTFDGDLKKLEDAKAWLLGMKKFFRIHDYSKNMKAIVSSYSFIGKSYIWWEDQKNNRAITEKELTWEEFEKLSKNNTYLKSTTIIRKRNSMNSKWSR